MRLLREWCVRCCSPLRAGRSDRDLEEELQLHLDLAAEDGRRRGFPLPPPSATRGFRSAVLPRRWSRFAMNEDCGGSTSCYATSASLFAF